MKYKTGVYQVLIFGEYGNKLKAKKATSFILARKKADNHILKHPEDSVVINRVLWNSKDKNDKWEATHGIKA